jgi:hypothetical protein
MYLDEKISLFTVNVHFPRYDFHEKTSSHDSDMYGTPCLRSRSGMHEFDFAVTECVRYCKFISSSYSISNADANAAAGTLDGTVLL